MGDPRIFCIGCNYSEHNREMGNPAPEDLVVFMKPATCLVPEGNPIRLPAHSRDVHHEAEVVLKLGKGGSNIPEADATGCVAAVAMGLDLTARDVQSASRKLGHPWETSKAFDGSAPIGTFVPVTPGMDITSISFSCTVNGQLRQEGNSGQMLFPIPRILSLLSRIWQLREGDLVYTGTPPGVGPIRSGDRIAILSDRTAKAEWNII